MCRRRRARCTKVFKLGRIDGILMLYKTLLLNVSVCGSFSIRRDGNTSHIMTPLLSRSHLKPSLCHFCVCCKVFAMQLRIAFRNTPAPLLPFFFFFFLLAVVFFIPLLMLAVLLSLPTRA